MALETTKGKNRHGVHDDDLVGFNVHITPELKALAQVTANESKTTMAEVMRRGFEDEAVRAGVMKNGEVLPKYKPIIKMYAEAYRLRNKENKEKAKARKGDK